MHADQIEQIAAWLAATDIGLLELRGPGQSLRLRHQGLSIDIVETDDTAPLDAPAPDAPQAVTVAASSVGVFLHRHPLREDALASPGTPVQPGQALGLLQIGPLLLPVLAPAAGIVLELLAAHGAVVGYATPLVALRDAATL
jgi:acetyl-CoA carboxylase biotin carboxyl carrier protein